MYQALYRAYRPEVFDEILGQEHVVKILKNQLAGNAVSHAYLFCGTHGTGKTTTARILAKGVNCTSGGEKPCGKCENCISVKEGTFLDVIEIDAASNNGVDNIRELRESVKYPPALGRKKVYIIDEVHMLSTGAFNALLKTLEEPPEHVMFILATTEPQKLPATILSRCMRLDFKRVPEKVLREGMTDICRQKGIEAEDAALRLIAMNADGSVRDGLSILDQCLAAGAGRVTRDEVLSLIGTAGQEIFIELTAYVASGNVERALILIDRLLADGKDSRQLAADWLAHYRSLMITKFVKNPEDLLSISSENCVKLAEQAERLDIGEINKSILTLAETSAQTRRSTQPRILLELAAVKLAGLPVAPETAGARERPKTTCERSATVEHGSARAENGSSSVERRSEAVITGEAERREEEPTEAERAAELPKTDAEQYDLEALWHRVFEEGETTKSSFNLIRTGTQLVAIDDKEFHVLAGNELKLRYVNENRHELQTLIERLTGKKLSMKAFVSKAEAREAQSAEKLKASVENALGIEVVIE